MPNDLVLEIGQSDTLSLSMDGTYTGNFDGSIIPASAFDAENTVKAYVDDSLSELHYPIFTGDVVEVDDIAPYKYLNQVPTGYYAQAICYDETNDVLYTSYHKDATNNSIIRKYADFANYIDGSSETASILIENNHINSLSIKDGKLYAFWLSNPKVSIIDTSTFSLIENAATGIYFRTACINDSGTAYQQVDSNLLFIVMPFPSEMSTKPIDGVTFSLPLPVNVSFVQDCDIAKNCFFRLCSGNYQDVQGSYLEIIPIWSSGGSSIKVSLPLPIDNLYEYEGISVASNRVLLTCGRQVMTSSKILKYIPETAKGSNLGWTTTLWGRLNVTQPNWNVGLPCSQDEDGVLNIYLPPQIQQNFLNLKLCFNPLTIKNHGAQATYIDLTQVTTSRSYPVFVWCLNSTGFGLAQFHVKRKTDATYGTMVTLTPVRYDEFNLSNNTVTNYQLSDWVDQIATPRVFISAN